MEAGPVIPKPEIKGARWIAAYEDWNVQRRPRGRAAGARPDRQRHVGHAGRDARDARHEARPSEGRRDDCAWVPSPTAATLHAIHYHQIDVAARQREIAEQGGATPELLDGILTPPLLDAAADGRGDSARARQQRAGNSGLRRALGRARRRLLEGAGHQRRRLDGGSRDAADLVAAHRELAASWHRRSRAGARDARAHGAKSSIGRTPATASYRNMAPRLRATASRSRRRWISCSTASRSRTATPSTRSRGVGANSKRRTELARRTKRRG